MPEAILPDRGKRMIARYLALNITHGAFGRGDWTDKFNPPLPNYFASGLANEFGRAPISAVRYLVNDPDGTIHYRREDGSTDGPYRYATGVEILEAANDPLGPLAPSSYLEVEFAIPENVAAGEVLCEVALFLNAETSVPGWAAPSEVVNPGQIAYLATIPAKTVESDDELVRRVLIKA